MLLLLCMACPVSAQAKNTTGFQTDKSGRTYYVNREGKRMQGLHKIKGKYYYFGKDTYLVKDDWIKVSGVTYRAKETGTLCKGFWTSKNGNTYYFDKNCARKYGWQKIDGSYYYFSNIGGIMAKKKTEDRIYLKKDGTAKVTASNKKLIDTYVTARSIVESQVSPSMSRSQKLRQCVNYVIAKPYKLIRYPFQTYKGWEIDYANDTFLRGGGTCFSDGASFAFLVHALGYKNVYACSNTGHGWAEINGRVYDPLMMEAYHTDHYYGAFAAGQNGYIATLKEKIG